MEALLVLLGLYLGAVLILFPIWVMLKFGRLRDEQATLKRQVDRLERELREVRATPRAAVAAALTPSAAAAVTVAPTPAVVTPAPPPAPPRLPVATPVATPAPVVPRPAPAPTSPSAPRPSPPPVVAPRASWLDSVNWEQFMGAKLFAWLGGLALFLGVAFFVKYSFEHNLIPAEVRVALGFLLAIGLVIGGLRLPRPRYAITAQTLIGVGIVSLYAVTFACRSIYHFAFFGPLPTFLLMVLITATAFVLAIRLEAKVVAVLGLLGGFLTPKLLATGVDNPGGLFGYLALLNAGLIAVALHRRWFHLMSLATAGTVLTLLVWTDRFYTPAKASIAMIVCLGFASLYFAAYLLARRTQRAANPVWWTALALPGVALGYALFFINQGDAAPPTWMLFGFIVASDALLLALAWLDERTPTLPQAAGLAVFVLLALWTTEQLTDELLPWALAMYLVFAVLHTAFPLVLARRRPTAVPSGWSQLFPPLALLLMLLPIFRLETVSFLIWPAVLLVDLLALGLAVLSASLVAVAAVFVLTLLATGACLFNLPAGTGLEPSLLVIIGGFALFFFAAGLWLVRKLGARLPVGPGVGAGLLGDIGTQLPAFAALMPFLLLIMACTRLAAPEPTALFGLGLLLVILALGLARQLRVAWLPACALVGIAALQWIWHSENFVAGSAAEPLVWHLVFYAIFTCYPFLFRREFAAITGPWAVAAWSGLAHFWVIYQTLKLAWPGWTDYAGVVPALFALAPLASLIGVLRLFPATQPTRLNLLAWFGGVALFFITLIFPFQFERQWLTVAWALEGAALLWLFHRVPHAGLRLVGVGLLLTAFARLALNPAVFGYHTRGDLAVLNWYLYAYGLAIAALFAGARLLAPPRHLVLGTNTPPLLATLAVILAFLLLNIEIADFFTSPGARSLAFQFSGNFARDMTYTIAWALFALGLLAAGIWRQLKPARYAAIALLSVALLKLFFHDLARLEALYRIGALFAVAIIAMLASFAYQRFQPSHEKNPPAV